MYELKERIKYSQLESTGGLSLKALLDIYQDCATLHTQDVGFPMDWFIDNDRAWFVIYYQLQNYRMPRHGEEVICTTFPVKLKGFMGYRLFKFETSKRELLAEAYSEWVYMDKVKLKPTRIPTEMAEAYEIIDMEFPGLKERKIVLDLEMEENSSFIVDGAYLDTNYHMNNACYITPAYNALTDKSLTGVRMEFRNSAKYLDKVIVKHGVGLKRELVSMESEGGVPFCIVEFSNNA